jgi:hypothetical protein
MTLQHAVTYAPLESAAERAIHARQHETGIVEPPGLSHECNLHHRCHQRRRDAVTRDVGDQDAQSIRSLGVKVVEVAADVAHRQIARGDTETGGIRKGVRQNGLLDLSSEFEFSGHRHELALPGEHSLGDEVAR